MYEMKPEYYIGIDMIDEEHKQLFKYADEAYELLHDEFTPDKYDRIDIILENLRNYTVKHFSDEEQYMESINYKKIFTQKVQHQEFIHKLDEFMEHHNDEVEDQDEEIMGILKYLTEWLINHILYVDGQIPKGWHYMMLGDLCDVTKGTTPTTIGMDFTDDGINFIKGESINDDHSFNKDLFAHIDDETDELLKRSRIIQNDIVFTIAGTLGKFALIDETVVPANTNQAIAIIRPRKIPSELLYSYFLGNWQVEFYKKNVQQAVQANLSLGTIKDLPVLLADNESQKKYQGQVLPLISAIKANHQEIEYLNRLKIQLLTRLSSSR